MFIKVSKTMHLFIRGIIRIRTNSWYSYSYSAEYSQPLFGTALNKSLISTTTPTNYNRLVASIRG